MRRIRARNFSGCANRNVTSGGQALVEFSLVFLFLAFFILGVLELVVFVYTYTALADSAKEGVRYAIVHGTLSSNCSGPGASGVTCPDTAAANVQTAATTYARYSMHDTSAMTITPTYPDGSSAAPSRVRVVVTYPYQPFFGLGWPTVTVRAAAEGRIMY
jgi:TadE-like protein